MSCLKRFVFFVLFICSQYFCVSSQRSFAINAPRNAAKGRYSSTPVLTDAAKNAIVNAHNLARSNAQPPPSNMRKISWLNDLERIATKYSKQCKFAINRNNNLKRFNRIEENIYVSRNIPYSVKYGAEATRQWNAEGKNYVYMTAKCSSRDGCSRYTQLVWADTFKVGCGVSKCSQIRVNGQVWNDATIIVCDYAPGGNWINSQPYLTGAVCSQCHSTDGCQNKLCTNPARDAATPPAKEWSAWTQWSQCSKTCGFATKKRNRYCKTFVKNDCPGRSFEIKYRCAKPCSRFPPRLPTPATTALWNRWSSWSKCSKTCGGGTQTKTRTCSSGNNANCKGNATSSKRCNATPCPSWNTWRNWGSCSKSCGPGRKTRTRACNTGNDKDCTGSSQESLACNQKQCVTQNRAAWSRWSTWGSCSATCGRATKSRTRTCNGASCTGQSTESVRCNIPACPFWRNWGRWTKCSASCGSGEKSRKRTCSQSAGCSGNPKETIPCNTNECPTVYLQWSSWSQCSATCGPGKKTKTRSCSSSRPNACSGPKEEIKACLKTACTSSRWGSWSLWSPCTSTCGSGTKSRSRICNQGNSGSKSCTGKPQDIETCNTNRCPTLTQWSQWAPCSVSCGSGKRIKTRQCSTGREKDCKGSKSLSESCFSTTCRRYVLAAWGKWKSCSVSCNGGVQSRTRKCTTGNSGPVICTKDLKEKRNCNSRKCPSFNKWTTWSECSATCGTGERSRHRSCSSSRTTDCKGIPSQKETCRKQQCNFSNWAPWMQWSSCSVSCAGGTRTRNRTCDLGNSGPACSGESTDRSNCNRQACPSFLAWSKWGSCSVTCGSGTKTRTRQCSNGNLHDCLGKSEDYTACTEQVCSLSIWGPWATWSACTTTCGSGKRERHRSCQLGNSGPPCQGNKFHIESCNTNACPAFSEWSNWSKCAVSCGVGVLWRNRACNTGRNSDCSGNYTETKTCTKVRCAVSAWSFWGPWDVCTHSCGSGTQTRSRICNKDQANSSCPGNAFSSASCNTDPCPVFGLWSSWSKCSTTCGDGVMERRRNCSGIRQTDCGLDSLHFKPCTLPISCPDFDNSTLRPNRNRGFVTTTSKCERPVHSKPFIYVVHILLLFLIC